MQSEQQSPIHIESPIIAAYRHPLKIRWSKYLDGELICHGGKVSVTFSGDVKERISFDDLHLF